MSDWITDRLPTEEDGDSSGLVWVSDLHADNSVDLSLFYSIKPGEPWMPIIPPDPYVKPGRFRVVENVNTFSVNKGNDPIAISIPTREAAERIADVYNEVMS